MKNSISYKSKELGFLLTKITLVSIAFIFIYFQLENKSNTGNMDLFLQLFNSFSLSSIVIIIGLSVLNIFFEILKWQNLVTFIKKISLIEALKQTLSGLTIAVFTPNGIGEYGAKVAYYPKSKTKQILLLNFLTNGIQMLYTLLFGCIGLVHFSFIKFNLLQPRKLITIFICLIILTTTLYLARKVTFLGINISGIVAKVKSIPATILKKNATYGLIRYIIFCHQYFFILTILGVQLPYTTVLTLIFIIYMTASIVPSFQLFDIAIKGSIGVYLFGLFQINSWIILFAASVMWTCNFLIPSTIGSIYVLKYNYQWK